LSKNKRPDFFVRNRILSFTLLTFLISYAFAFFIGFFFTNKVENPLLKMYLTNVFVVMGPFFAAIFMKYKTSGKSGVYDLLKALKPNKTSGYLLLSIPLFCFMLSFTLFFFAGIPMETIQGMLLENWHLAVVHLLIHIAIIGTAEEIGWRGWMLPELLKKQTLAGATFIIFVIWTLWHFPKLIVSWEISLPYVLIAFSYTIILSFIWIKSKGNTLAVAIVHGTFNAPIFFLESQISTYSLSADSVGFGWMLHSVVYLGIALTLLLLSRNIWWKKEKRQPIEEKPKALAEAN
jgi:uncharacterized protein